MKKLILFLFLFLLAMPLAAQVPAVSNPQVPFSGQIGPGGKFPLSNNGSITMTDADYTMRWPDFSASVIQVQGALTQTRTLYAPATHFGFEYTIQNATTGNQSIVVKPEGNAAATGVTIPNGQAVTVIFDGTNYVSIGSAAGFGTVVTSPPIQDAINAAAAAGGSSHPVVIPPNYAGTDSFTNPGGVRVYDYRQKNGIDSRFFRDASEWGVKADGKVVLGCTATAGSAIVDCPVAHFQASDRGKVVVARGPGASTGRLYDFSVVSGGTGGTDGYQPVTFTGLTGCTSTFNQPIVYVKVVGGVPQTGPVIIQPVNYGIGCTSIPTQGTVATVTGTVTFTGGKFIYGDLPSSIVAVNSPTEIVLADNAVTTDSTAALIYGTDDNDGTNNNWNAACNAMAEAGGVASFGHLTFSGLSLVTHGIDCKGSGIYIEGSGIETYTAGIAGGSTLLYAGKTTGDHVLQMSGGNFTRLERLRIDGNSQAMPYGLLLSQGVTGMGNGPAAQGRYEQIAFGSYLGDAQAGNYAVVPQLQSCVFSDGVRGNQDFNTFDNIYCWAAKVATDCTNNQATNWKIGKWNSQYDEIGLVNWNIEQVEDYYTEYNRLDIMMGSPIHAACTPGQLTIQQYGGESSAEQIAMSPIMLGGVLHVLNGYGNSQTGCDIPGTCLEANGVAFDAANWTTGTVDFQGQLIGKVLRGQGCASAQLQFNVTTSPDDVIWTGAWDPTCSGLFTQRQVLTIPDVRAVGQSTVDLSVLSSLLNPNNSGITQEHDQTYNKTIGSMDIVSPTPPGTTGYPSTPLAWITWSYQGTGGTTTYNYQITCVDGAGRETAPTIISMTAGAPALSPPPNGNWNRIAFWNHEGCAEIKFYGDEGSGSVGYLATFRVMDLPASDPHASYPNVYIDDWGQYTKNTSVLPPTTSQSGIVNAQNGYQVNGIALATYHLKNWLSTDNTSFVGDIAQSDGSHYKGSFIFPNQSGIPGVTAGGGTTQFGYTTIATGGPSAVSGGAILCHPITAAQNAMATDMVMNFTTAGTGSTLIGAIYNSDGSPLSGFSYNQPGTLVCQGSGPLVAGSNIISLPGCKLSQGKTYHLCYQAYGGSGASSIQFDTLGGPPPDTMYCGNPNNNLGYIPPDFSKDPNLWCGTTNPVGEWPTLYIDGTLQPSINANNYTTSNPIPANLLGSGATGSGTNCLLDNQTWGACGSGGGGGNVPFNNITTGTLGASQILTVGSTGSQITPGSTAGAVIANVLGAATVSGGLNGIAYPIPALTPGYLQFTGSGFAWGPGGSGGGGSTSWSDLTPPTKDLGLTMGNWRTAVSYSFAGDNSGGTAFGISQSGTGTATNYTLLNLSTGSPNVAPFVATNSAGNGLRIGGVSSPWNSNIIAQGTSKFVGPVQLTGLNSAASLATDATGNIIAGTGGGAGGGWVPVYNTPVTGVLTLNAGAITTITMDTPAVDTNYFLGMQLKQITPAPVGCTTAGSLQVRIAYTDADNGVLVNMSGGGVAAYPSTGGGNSAVQFGFANGAPSTAQIWSFVPTTFRARNGVAVTLTINQSVASVACSTFPSFILRPALYSTAAATD